MPLFRKLIDELYKQILALAAGLKQGVQDQKIYKSSKQSGVYTIHCTDLGPAVHEQRKLLIKVT